MSDNNQFVAVIYDSPTAAAAGRARLEKFTSESDVKLIAVVTLTKDSKGNPTLRDAQAPGPYGIGIAAMVGGIAGLLGGPLTAAFGAVTGAVSGSLFEANRTGAREAFLQKVADKMKSGKTAVLAELWESREGAIDERLKTVSGEIIRE